jgi:NADPH:quinone reductase-like Zn-dependent oxidoreductase
LRRVEPDKLPVRTRNAGRGDGTLVPYRLETKRPGILSNLSLNETPRRDPGPHEVELRVKAGGINFRDVLKALGAHPGNPIDVLWFGDDVAGTIERVGSEVHGLRPGDAVVGMAPYGFQAFASVDQRMLFRKPQHLTFEQAATIPTVFLTAHYALIHLARMKAGEKILIHAGTGGVGQAAIQIAKYLGLEIFATAGTSQKRELLKELGAHHALDSRTLAFADAIRELTQGRGVDAVLNSLAGDFIPKSLSILAPYGRFLEIGKVDIYKNSKIGLEVLRNNNSYFVIDLVQHAQIRPDFVASLLREIQERLETSDYQPLRYTVFPITGVVDAFRYMAQGKHVGKNVLSFDVPVIPIGLCTQPQHRRNGTRQMVEPARRAPYRFIQSHWAA